MAAATDPGLVAWLRFLDDCGVDLDIADAPRPWTRPAPAHAAPPIPPSDPRPAVPLATEPAPAAARLPLTGAGAAPGTGGAAADARRLAAQARNLDELMAILAAFDACPLQRTAMNLCVGDGDPASGFMLVGEAPGAEEDRQGKPFVGPSGQLLDRMLAAAGRPRARCWITNCVFWRPPGNRTPTSQELAMCLPFVERQIELLRPKAVLFVGGIAVRALLDLSEGVTRLRGRKLRYPLADGTTLPATVMFHPAYLLRRPHLKGLAWRDLLMATAMAEEA